MVASWVKLVGLVGILYFYGGECVKQRGNPSPDACTCVPWGNLYNKDFIGGMTCDAGVAGLSPGEACPFFKKFHSNACIGDAAGREGFSDSYCMVSKACPTAVPIDGSIWAKKICNSAHDAVLMDFSFKKLRSMAAQHEVDLSTLVGFATRHIEKNVTKTTRKEIEAIKATGRPTLISQKNDLTGRKLHIRGPQVWEHNFDHSQEGYWEMVCVEGCSGAKTSKTARKATVHDCECENWADVFNHTAEEGGMNCESYLPNGLAAGEFCELANKLRTNMCLHEYHSEESILATPHCLVKSTCATAMSTDRNVLVRTKSCKKDDVWISKLSVAKLLELATTHGLDFGIFLGFATTFLGKPIEDVTPGEVDNIKESRIPTYIWSNDDYYADRILIKDGEVHTLTFSPESDVQWDVTCQEGCP